MLELAIPGAFTEIAKAERLRLLNHAVRFQSNFVCATTCDETFPCIPAHCTVYVFLRLQSPVLCLEPRPLLNNLVVFTNSERSFTGSLANLKQSCSYSDLSSQNQQANITALSRFKSAFSVFTAKLYVTTLLHFLRSFWKAPFFSIGKDAPSKQ